MKALPTPSNDLTLRPLRADEAPHLAALWHNGWRIGHADIVPPGLLAHRDGATFLARVERDLASFFVAEVDTQIAAFIRIVGNELDQFYVAPDRMGTGFAAKLMQAAEAQLMSCGVARAYLIASVGNDRAIRFYEKMGWANCGTSMAEVATLDGSFSLEVVRLEKTLIG